MTSSVAILYRQALDKWLTGILYLLTAG